MLVLHRVIDVVFSRMLDIRICGVSRLGMLRCMLRGEGRGGKDHRQNYGGNQLPHGPNVA